jgi:hypothetical protein
MCGPPEELMFCGIPIVFDPSMDDEVPQAIYFDANLSCRTTIELSEIVSIEE